MALIVGAIVNMTSTLPAQANHGDSPILKTLTITPKTQQATGTPVTGAALDLFGVATNPSALKNECHATTRAADDSTSITGRDYGDLLCKAEYSTDAIEITLKAEPGTVASTDQNGIHVFAEVPRADHLAKVGGVEVPPAGLDFDLDEGDNTFTVTVEDRDTPSISVAYEVVVTRKTNDTPFFASSYPAKNNRFEYGYAENLMELKGNETSGTASRYNHPSDGLTYDSTSPQSYYRKNTDTKRFVRGDEAEFSSTGDAPATIAFTAVMHKGLKDEGTSTTPDDNRSRDTDTVNLSEGIVITAMQRMGWIDLPRAMGGNPTSATTAGHRPYVYALEQVGKTGNDLKLPDGLTTQYLIWTDVAEDPDGDPNTTPNYDNNNDGDETDPKDGNVQSHEVVASGSLEQINAAGEVLVGLRLLSKVDAGESDDTPSNFPRTDSSNSADRSVHTLVYRATDGDSYESASDAAEVVFDVTIQKGLVAFDPPPDADGPAKNELSSLSVGLGGTAVTNSTYTPREWPSSVEMDPKEFDHDVTTYRVTIPYERDEVTVTAGTSYQDTTLKLITDGGDIKMTPNRPMTFSNLLVGSKNPRVRIEVTPDADSGLSKKTYTIYISRDYNTPAQFDTSDKPENLNFYDGVPIEAVNLPGGRLGNGDPAPEDGKLHGEWRYDLSLKGDYTGAYTGTADTGAGFPYGEDLGDGNGVLNADPDARTQDTRTTSTWLPSPPGFSYTVKDVDSGDGVDVRRQMTGTPNLSNTQAISKYSDFTMLYVAKDGDLDDTAADNAEHEFNVRVWRNVLLNKLEVDTTPGTSGTIGPAGEVYEYSATSKDRTYTKWNKTATYEYSYTVDHDVPQVVVVPTPYLVRAGGYAAVAEVVSPPDANTSTATRHEVELKDGNNMVTIEVTNGGNVGTHKLNIYRRPLGANPITVTAIAGNRTVELDPDFDVEDTNYTATVESHEDTLFIEVETTHPDAQVSVNYIDAGRNKSKEVAADPGENTYRVDINLGDDQTTYWLRITRKGNVVPSFGSATVASMTKQVGKALVTCETDGTKPAYIELPEAENSGNGASQYSIDSTTLPDGVSFNAATRRLTGTPVLRQAYERSYDIAYVVSDSDTDTTSADTDTITFTMTVTNDTVDPCAGAGDPTPAARNLLTNLLVIYDLPALNKTDVEATLTPEFDSSELSYTSELPHGSTNRRIAAYVNRGASVLLNQVVIPHGVHTPLNQDANRIRVTYPELPSTNYGLTITEAAPSVPALSETVPDQRWQAGKAITAMSLPVATGGNAPLTYSLADHQSRMPSGLSFNAETRVLSGTPSLENVDSAETAIYVMTYTVTDRDGDTDTDEFRITITTDPVDVANPGSKPMSLNVVRTGTSANLTWNAGDDASKQAVVALQLDDVPGTVQIAEIAAGVETHRFTGLRTGPYMFFVVGYDSSGNYKDAAGDLYSPAPAVQ